MLLQLLESYTLKQKSSVGKDVATIRARPPLIHTRRSSCLSLSQLFLSVTPGALWSAVHHLPTLHTCRNTQTTFAHNHLSAYESIHSAVLACTHILAHINLLIFKQSVIHFLPENASASQTVRNVVKMDCIQMQRSLLRLVGCLPMYFPIAVLYQAGKLAH